MANIKPKLGLVIEGMLHARKSIRWRNGLPSPSGRLEDKSQDVDKHAALFYRSFSVTFKLHLCIISSEQGVQLDPI